MSAKAGAGALALDFTGESVDLYARDKGRYWVKIDSAVPGAEDFDARIAALRTAAFERAPKRSPVTIWLPEDQVFVRRYMLLASTEAYRRVEAARRIASETSYSADELSVAVTTPKEGAQSGVLAVLLQTMTEARAYVAGWGFEPGPISTRIGTDGFGPEGPVFEFPDAAVRRAGRTARHVAIAATALMVVAGAGIGGYRFVQPMLIAPATISVADPPMASFTLVTETASTRAAALRTVDTEPVGNLEAPGPVSPVAMQAPAVENRAFAGNAPATAPNAPLPPIASDPMRVGHAPEAPKRDRPVTLAAPPEADALPALPTETATAPSDNAVSAGADALPAATEETPAADGILLAANEAAPSSSALPPPRPSDPGETADKPTPPEAATAAPAAPETETETDATDAGTPDTSAEDRAGTVPEPKPAPGAAEPDLSAFAAVKAPPPSRRPRTLELVTRRASKPLAAPANVLVPRSVRSAATKQGLMLGEPSLVGVIDGRSGRKALVRMPDGEFRRLGRGDLLDGWRVNSITSDALRMTKQGRNRTLLLITR